MKKAKTASEANVLEAIPNVGPAVANELRRVGIRSPGGLKGEDPYALYQRLCARTGTRHDPCLLDAFIAATRFMEGGPVLPWWHFTPERKRIFGS